VTAPPPGLRKAISDGRAAREAADRQREIAQLVLQHGARIAVVHRLHGVSAETWPLRGDPQPPEVVPISWVEFAANQGWIGESGHQVRVSSSELRVAWVLTPRGRRLADG
jgi:hypothetical protein